MLPEWYGIYKNKIDEAIKLYLKNYLDSLSLPSQALKDFREVLEYSVDGGKRFRAILGLEFYLSLTGKSIDQVNIQDDIFRYIVAVEYIHSFSLIHDDLPCMDNDQYRRGKLTVWKKYGEYKAVLAGDTLNTLAFELLSQISSAELSRSLTQTLARATGFFGMIGGQVEDIFYEEKMSEVSEDILKSLHSKKTVQVIAASIVGAVILAGKEDVLERYKLFGERLGLAFQIKDDILDVEGTFEETGKSTGGENKGFVYVLGIEKSKNQLDTLIKNCLNDIVPLKSEKLDFVVQYVQDRKK